jgi:hypothetical protein
MEPSADLFSAAGLTVLDCQPYDPDAKGSYELMSGGLMWPDEHPKIGSPGCELISLVRVYRFLIAYRASITLGEERAEFRPVWEQVVRDAPNWPGLRQERRGEKAKKRLLAAKRRESVCFDEMERMFEARKGEGS